MRSSLKILVAAAATLLVAPQLAMADDIEEQLRAMDERMSQLETQLQATQDELSASTDTVAAQQELIEKAGLDRRARSGLSAFLSQTEFGGFVAASWAWNFNDPQNIPVAMNNPLSPVSEQFELCCFWADDGSVSNLSGTVGGENSGTLGLTAPQHSNHNSFQVDQLWFSMRKPATAESRGGFGADLVWGVAADTQTPAGLPWYEAYDTEYYLPQSASGDLPHLYQAYAEYLMPIGNGVYVKAGRWATLIGAETFRADQNYNITRGLLWSIQPVNHTGLIIGGDFENGFTWALAAANSYSATMADADNGKTFVGRVGYRGETFSLLVNGLWGGDAADVFGGLQIATDGDILVFGGGTREDKIGLIDVVLNWDPSENLSTWLNFDYYWTEEADVGEDLSALNIYGVAAGARLALTDATGFTVRYEWLRFQDHPFGFAADGLFDRGSLSQDMDLQSVTGTLDHELSDNLTVLAEIRYDRARSEGTPDEFFVVHDEDPGSGDFWTHDDQILALVQLLYRF